jgi:lipopolysaccharide biosynthesis glycosyltransferase
LKDNDPTMTQDKLKVFIGYDSRETIAWQVCQHSLLRHAKTEIEIYPIKQQTLRELGLYTRPRDATASTEFSLTRFLTPYLAAHDGWTVFVDCDFLFTTDITKVVEGLDRLKAVHVVQHDYTPANRVKMDAQTQTTYPRKNWSSFMLFNNAHPAVKALTPAVANLASPAFLHRLQWISDESLIGALPRTWNFLVGEYPKPAELPHAIHFTNGGPWFEDWKQVDYADLWCAERDLYLGSLQEEKAV